MVHLCPLCGFNGNHCGPVLSLLLYPLPTPPSSKPPCSSSVFGQDWSHRIGIEKGTESCKRFQQAMKIFGRTIYNSCNFLNAHRGRATACFVEGSQKVRGLHAPLNKNTRKKVEDLEGRGPFSKTVDGSVM